MAKPKYDPRKVHGKARDRAHAWAARGRDTAVHKHDTAPRGGTNINMFGQRRSAPGEAPAEETGRLKHLLRKGLIRERDASAFVVNYTVLEHGYSKGGRVLEPRPLGRMAVSELKARDKP